MIDWEKYNYLDSEIKEKLLPQIIFIRRTILLILQYETIFMEIQFIKITLKGDVGNSQGVMYKKDLDLRMKGILRINTRYSDFKCFVYLDVFKSLMSHFKIH